MIKLPINNMSFQNEKLIKKLVLANNRIGELNGIIKLLPNPNVFFNAIILGEAKESSEIENVVTTYDELFKESVLKENNVAAKEVVNYRQAALYRFEQIKIITTIYLVDRKNIVMIQF